MQFKLRDSFWLLTVVVLVTVILTTNRKLDSIKQVLAENNLELEACREAQTEWKQNAAGYRLFFRRGCEYMDHGLYKEAIACFVEAKHARNDVAVMERLIECHQELDDDVRVRLYITEMERLLGVRSKR